MHMDYRAGQEDILPLCAFWRNRASAQAQQQDLAAVLTEDRCSLVRALAGWSKAHQECYRTWIKQVNQTEW